MHQIQVIDSHTGGEPTRVVIAGGPPLGTGSIAEQQARFRANFDHFRTAILGEPRGSDVLVGALLCPPVSPDSTAGVIFFNNVDYLGMCGHGTIGLAITLGHMGRIGPGRFLLDTSVGQVAVEYDGQQTASIENVASYRHAADVRVQVPGYGELIGDVAWGGNWFFIVKHSPIALELKHASALTELALRIRTALEEQGITGAAGAFIDHIELTGPAADPQNHGRNFMLCPGGAYDRSPCGTGTSAKLACLASAGKLQPGQIWRQESILGSVFQGSYRTAADGIIPTITGQAFVTAEAQLIINKQDPFGWGIRLG